MNAAAGSLWYVPGSFSIGRILGPKYSLRCVLFHDISDTESVFTKGLDGAITRKNFERALKFITQYYTPISLQEVLDSFEGRALPPRPILVTFDDAYASVSEGAAPLCLQFGVPAVFFVNAACLDNRELALDNLICFVANVSGLNTVNAAIRDVTTRLDCDVRSLSEVFGTFLPSISLSARQKFRSRLLESLREKEGELAEDAGLYLNCQQLRELANFSFEIGNHTYTHVHCRSLQDAEFAEEIDRNRTTLEQVSGRRVRSFSVPYGSSVDLNTQVMMYLRQSGYEAVFLAEGRANFPSTSRLGVDRISIKAESEAALFSEIEVLPRLRSARDRVLTVSHADDPPSRAELRDAPACNKPPREPRRQNVTSF